MTLIAVLATLGLAAPQLASSAPSQDPRAEREAVRAERARVAANIDTSKASLGQIDDALQTLDQNLRTQQSALARTEDQVTQAEADLSRAEAAITTLTKEVKILTAEMRRRAIDAYVNPVADDVITVLDTKDFTTASNRKFYVELRAQDDADVTDRLEGAGKDLQFQRRKATEAKATAEAKRAEQQRRTTAVANARQKQQRVADRLRSTIDSQVARSIQLAKTDRALSVKIAQQQAALVARLAAQKAAEEAAAAKANAARRAEQRRIAKAAAAANVADDGREQAPSVPARSAPASPSDQASSRPSASGAEQGSPAPESRSSSSGASVSPGPVDAGIQLAYVQGVPVNAQVAEQVSAMINAAAADGVNLRIGNSYRSVTNQIELRRQNCGNSYYAIYQMPAGNCRPPTGQPGQSQHQLGLAIDFAACSRGSACFGWLSRNASRFGYYNLPAESWHWSTTGT